jgi:hypothetical protein
MPGPTISTNASARATIALNRAVAVVSVLDAIQKDTGSLLGIQQDALLKMVKTRLPDWVNVSLSTLKRARAYRRLREGRRECAYPGPPP